MRIPIDIEKKTKHTFNHQSGFIHKRRQSIEDPLLPENGMQISDNIRNILERLEVEGKPSPFIKREDWAMAKTANI